MHDLHERAVLPVSELASLFSGKIGLVTAPSPRWAARPLHPPGGPGRGVHASSGGHVGSASPRPGLPLTQDRGHIPVSHRAARKVTAEGPRGPAVAPALAPRSRKVVCDQNGPNQLTLTGLLQNAGTRRCVQKQNDVLARVGPGPRRGRSTGLFWSVAQRCTVISQINCRGTA